MSVNKVILVGRIGKDPETKQLTNGQVTNATLATSETWKDKDGTKKTATEWHNLQFWNNNSKIAAEYVKKGDLLYVEGSIHTRSWDDKDGNKRYSTEIKVNHMTMLGGSKQTDSGQSEKTTNQSKDNFFDEPDNNDLAF